MGHAEYIAAALAAAIPLLCILCCGPIGHAIGRRLMDADLASEARSACNALYLYHVPCTSRQSIPCQLQGSSSVPESIEVPIHAACRDSKGACHTVWSSAQWQSRQLQLTAHTLPLQVKVALPLLQCADFGA